MIRERQVMRDGRLKRERDREIERNAGKAALYITRPRSDSLDTTYCVKVLVGVRRS